jgi:hypothetical protein
MTASTNTYLISKRRWSHRVFRLLREALENLHSGVDGAQGSAGAFLAGQRQVSTRGLHLSDVDSVTLLEAVDALGTTELHLGSVSFAKAY